MPKGLGRLALYYAKSGARQICQRVLDRARPFDPGNPKLLYYQAVLAQREHDRSWCAGRSVAHKQDGLVILVAQFPSRMPSEQGRE